MNKLVSIIIPHFNNETILLNCIQSIYISTYKNFEIIIVDNASTDDSIKKAKSEFPSIRIIKLDYNSGYAGGCNHGAKEAKGEYLFFLNNDTTIDSNCIDELVKQLLLNNKISSVQPKILNMKHAAYFDYAGASGGFMDYLVFPFTRGRIFNTIEKDDSQYNDSRKIFWASGAGFLTRKIIFEKLYRFDEKLFAHMEEIDYHWKSYLAGFEVWINPKATIQHLGGGTLNMQSSKKTYYNHRNSLILLLTNYTLLRSTMFFLLRLPLEIISSLKELLCLRPMHFLYHYIALLWLIPNIIFIKSRRSNIAKIRILSDKELMSSGIIYNRSIVIQYFLMLKKKYKDLND